MTGARTTKAQRKINNAALDKALAQHAATMAERERKAAKRRADRVARTRAILDDERVKQGKLPKEPVRRAKIVAQREAAEKRLRESQKKQFRRDVIQKLSSSETIFTRKEMEVVDEIARLAKHKFLLGETRFKRYEIRACGAERRAVWSNERSDHDV